MALRRFSNERSPVSPHALPTLLQSRPPPRSFGSGNRDLSGGISSPRGTSRIFDTSNTSSKMWSKYVLLLSVVVLAFVAGSYSKHVYMKKEIKAVEASREILSEKQKRLMHDLNEALRTIDNESHIEDVVKVLQQEKRNLLQDLEEEREHSKTKDHFEHQVKQSQNHVKKLQESVQRLSKQHAIEHFGLGPHYVEFQLEMTLENGKQVARYFTVEMAPLDLMPVTVNLFLEQVKRGFWDNTSFHWNAKHIIMADTDRKEELVNEGIAHVPFQEYNEEFPHVAYTLGFTGDPAGPMFYINKIDNSFIHGPHEKRSFGSAEPCFAKVIVGEDTVDLMAKQPTPEHFPDGFLHPIQIKAARVMELIDVHGGVEHIKANGYRR